MTIESGAFKDSDNTDVEHLIEQELEHWGPAVHEVHVEVQDQLVTLSGTVGSYYLKQVAQETVWHVRPDLQVVNAIQVKPR
jgi:osmotically-inducible protein OsmY